MSCNDPNPQSSELELSTEEFRSLVSAAVERIGGHIETFSDRPAYRPAPADAITMVREPIPTEATPVGDVLDRLFNDLLPWGVESAGPGYLAYGPSGGILQAAVADLIAAAVNRYVGNWAAAPGLAELEATVVRWFAEMIGYPRESRGYLSSGGSLANFSAVLAARRARLGDSLTGGTAYGSDFTHHSVLKALGMAGLPPETFREVRSDAEFRLPADALRDRIRVDRRNGLRPFLLVATAGTTLAGAVDDLVALAEVAREEGLWFHVDAAYGGFFLLTDRGRALLTGIDRADSVTLIPHKSLFLPYGTGALLVRDGETLRDAHQSPGARYSPRQTQSDRVDFCEYSPELSRELRGLRVWLPMKMHGVGAFQRSLDEKLDLTQLFAAQLRTIPGVELIAEPVLTIVAFRWVLAGLDQDETDALNRRLLDAVNSRGRVMLMGVTLCGRFAIRACFLSFRTHREVLEHAFADIRDEIHKLSVP